MNVFPIEAKYIRTTCFWDSNPEYIKKRFNIWMRENPEIKIISINEHSNGHGSIVKNVTYLITQEMHDEDVKKAEEWERMAKERAEREWPE